MNPRRFSLTNNLFLMLMLLITSACSHQTAWPAAGQAAFAAMSLIDSGNVCVADHSILSASSSFFVLLTAGLLTGLSHCVGMCGPLVGAFALHRRAERKELSTPLVLFQIGRLTTYVALGALVGSAGYLLASLIRDWQGLLSATIGLVTIILGLSLLGLLPFQHWLASTELARWVGTWIRRLMTSTHPAAPFGLGLANGLLPCGPVYAMALLAAATGGPWQGAGLMLLFGLGTLPAMLSVGFSTSLLSIGLRSYLYRVAAVLVVFVGLQLTMRGLALGGQIPHTAIGSIMLW